MKTKRYILFKDGRAFDLLGNQIISSFNIVDEEKAQSEYGMEKAFIEIYYHDERGSFCEYDGKGGRTMDWWYLDQIAKQAETVEELCDEYVAVRKSDNAKRLGKIDILWFKEQTGWLGRLEDYKSIHGAVWIMGLKEEPILKSIAKMNESEEFELL